jgi:hypothetical protein
MSVGVAWIRCTYRERCRGYGGVTPERQAVWRGRFPGQPKEFGHRVRVAGGT